MSRQASESYGYEESRYSYDRRDHRRSESQALHGQARRGYGLTRPTPAEGASRGYDDYEGRSGRDPYRSESPDRSSRRSSLRGERRRSEDHPEKLEQMARTMQRLEEQIKDLTKGPRGSSERENSRSYDRHDDYEPRKRRRSASPRRDESQRLSYSDDRDVRRRGVTRRRHSSSPDGTNSSKYDLGKEMNRMNSKRRDIFRQSTKISQSTSRSTSPVGVKIETGYKDNRCSRNDGDLDVSLEQPDPCNQHELSVASTTGLRPQACVQPDLRIQLGAAWMENYAEKIGPDDIIIVPDFFGKEGNVTFLEQLKKELADKKGSHASISKPLEIPSVRNIRDRIQSYFKLKPGSISVNVTWRTDNRSSQRYYRDQAAFSAGKKRQNTSIIAIFGAARELAFIRDHDLPMSATRVYIPQRNNTIICFGSNVNIRWMHGVNDLLADCPAETIQVCLWGQATDCTEDPLLPLLPRP